MTARVPVRDPTSTALTWRRVAAEQRPPRENILDAECAPTRRRHTRKITETAFATDVELTRSSTAEMTVKLAVFSLIFIAFYANYSSRTNEL